MSSSRKAARGDRAAAFFGALAVLAIPIDVAAAQYLNGVELLRSLYFAVPIAAVLALTALPLPAGAAWHGRAASTRAAAAGAPASPGRASTCAVTGGIALAIYGGLRAAE